MSLENSKTADLNNIYDYLYHWMPVIGYCLLIFYMSSRPVDINILTGYSIDKILHITEYSILSFLIARGFFKSSMLSGKQIMLLSILLTMLYGVSDEMHQSFVPSRQADLLDVMADTIGAYIGQRVYFLTLKRTI